MAESDKPVTISNPWTHLRRHTPARIALGRTGVSLPTSEHLAFQLAHARARSAVHHALDFSRLREDLSARFGPVVEVESAAPDRPTYLQRPDLGRRLSPASASRLAAEVKGPFDIAFVIADGLSAYAIEKKIVPFLDAILPLVDKSGWSRAPLILAAQGRVALGDEIGAILGSRLVAMLIGERPGLTINDALSFYGGYKQRWEPLTTDGNRDNICMISKRAKDPLEAAAEAVSLIKDYLKYKSSGVALAEAKRAG